MKRYTVDLQGLIVESQRGGFVRYEDVRADQEYAVEMRAMIQDAASVIENKLMPVIYAALAKNPTAPDHGNTGAAGAQQLAGVAGPNDALTDPFQNVPVNNLRANIKAAESAGLKRLVLSHTLAEARALADWLESGSARTVQRPYRCEFCGIGDGEYHAPGCPNDPNMP